MTENMSLENMRDLVLMKESFEIKRFAKILKEKIMEKGQAFYDVWMYQSNDDIQTLATAFGDRYFLQSAWKVYSE